MRRYSDFYGAGGGSEESVKRDEIEPENDESRALFYEKLSERGFTFSRYREITYAIRP